MTGVGVLTSGLTRSKTDSRKMLMQLNSKGRSAEVRPLETGGLRTGRRSTKLSGGRPPCLQRRGDLGDRFGKTERHHDVQDC